ncbi:hypothetical protein pb186bvf_003217 [Paramecium bursaria]
MGLPLKGDFKLIFNHKQHFQRFRYFDQSYTRKQFQCIKINICLLILLKLTQIKICFINAQFQSILKNSGFLIINYL